MKIMEIPFVELVGVKQENNTLSLEYKENLLNHLNTLHAGAQFTLAESASGIYLKELFPQLVDKVVPILRGSKIKYKKPVYKKLTAFANVDESQIEKFSELFNKKNRASIEVSVELIDTDKTIVSISSFSWFIQKII